MGELNLKRPDKDDEVLLKTDDSGSGRPKMFKNKGLNITLAVIGGLIALALIAAAVISIIPASTLA